MALSWNEIRNRAIGIYTTNFNGVSGANTLRYFHTDAQGSIVAITSGDAANAGAVVGNLSYDPWGKRRNTDATDDTTNNLQAVNTDHGYTGHEYIDELGLIHMNGRMYDPRLARFLEPDQNIQAPGNLQSFNRYSYVMNNPFIATDPSGFVGEENMCMAPDHSNDSSNYFPTTNWDYAAGFVSNYADSTASFGNVNSNTSAVQYNALAGSSGLSGLNGSGNTRLAVGSLK